MLRALFLIDHENGCQDFLQNFTLPVIYFGNPLFKAKVFVQKGTDKSKLTSMSKYVTIQEAFTNGPEAADLSLVLFAAKLLSDHHDRYNHQAERMRNELLSSYDNIYLVKGGEKGYGELIARLQAAHKGKFEDIDGREMNIGDYFPKQTCQHCKIVVKDPNECDRHKTFSREWKACPGCAEEFECPFEKKAEIKKDALQRLQKKWLQF